MGKKCSCFAGETRWRGRDPEIGRREKSSHPSPSHPPGTANESELSIKTKRTPEPRPAPIAEG